ncbi:hypothetical protein PS918_01102 [Pseudomonas fluorescens]|uniref:Competence protein n=1 Tax=Pseudomonas fluorescens TaxID=294 RepID=A0A5E7RBU9_PSEFL|nr:hypothetical protein [Pseudomonas fluorescens]VVP70968.1 hypothetical protein PS918_01102 [Pseudomonas fluorescens]
MPNHRLSFLYYKKLIFSLEKKFVDGIPAKHDRLLCDLPDSSKYYQKLYLEQVESFNLGVPAMKGPLPLDENCKYCSKFHLANLKTIDKDLDISTGKDLEDKFQDFLQEILSTECPGATVKRADKKNLHNPDFLIEHSGKPIIWIEFKVIFRPYLTISKLNPNYQCYSHSLTLDISNGKKLINQRELVESQNIGIDNCIYVYWYDLPCVKGIFWMAAKHVYKHQDNQTTYERRIVPGDKTPQGKLRAAVKKIYLPLHEMNDFYSIFSLIRAKLRHMPKK